MDGLQSPLAAPGVGVGVRDGDELPLPLGDLSPGSALVAQALQADLQRLKERHSFEQATAELLKQKAQEIKQQHHHQRSSDAVPGMGDEGFLGSPGAGGGGDVFNASLSTGATTPYAESSIGFLGSGSGGATMTSSSGAGNGGGSGSVPQSPATQLSSSLAAAKEQARRLQAYQQLQAQHQSLHQYPVHSDDDDQDDEGDEHEQHGGAGGVHPHHPALSQGGAGIAATTPVTGSRKSGLGSKSNSSCHQCKSSKPDNQLYFCTNAAKEGVRKRRCRKKYCRACLRRCYPNCFPEALQGSSGGGADSNEDGGVAIIPRGHSWECPSCAMVCICASCTRKGKTKLQQQQQHRAAQYQLQHAQQHHQQHVADFADGSGFQSPGTDGGGAFSALHLASPTSSTASPTASAASISSPMSAASVLHNGGGGVVNGLHPLRSPSAALARNLQSLGLSAGQGLNFQQVQMQVQQRGAAAAATSFMMHGQPHSGSLNSSASSSSASASGSAGSSHSNSVSLSPNVLMQQGLHTPGSTTTLSASGGASTSAATSPNPLLGTVSGGGHGGAMMADASPLAPIGSVSSPGGASHISAFSFSGQSIGTTGGAAVAVGGSGSGSGSHGAAESPRSGMGITLPSGGRLSHEDAASYLARLQRLQAAHNAQAQAAMTSTAAADAELAQVQQFHQQGGGGGERGAKYSKLSESHRYSPALGRSSAEPHSASVSSNSDSSVAFSPSGGGGAMASVHRGEQRTSGGAPPLAPHTPDRPLRRVGSGANVSSAVGSGAPSPRTMVSAVHRHSGGSLGERRLSARGVDSPPQISMLPPLRSASGGHGSGVALAQLVDTDGVGVTSAVVLSSASPAHSGSHQASPLLRGRSITPDQSLPLAGGSSSLPGSTLSKKRKLPPSALQAHHQNVSVAQALHMPNTRQQGHAQGGASLYHDGSDEYGSGNATGTGSGHYSHDSADGGSPLAQPYRTRGASSSHRHSSGSSSLLGSEHHSAPLLAGDGAEDGDAALDPAHYSQLMESERRIQQMERELRALQAQQRQLLQSTVHLHKQHAQKALLQHQGAPVAAANGRSHSQSQSPLTIPRSMKSEASVKSERISPPIHPQQQGAAPLPFYNGDFAARAPQFEEMRDPASGAGCGGLASPLSSISPPVPSTSSLSSFSMYPLPLDPSPQPSESPEVAAHAAASSLRSPSSSSMAGVRASPDVNMHLLGLSISVSEAEMASRRNMPPSEAASMLSPPPPLMFDSPQPVSSSAATAGGQQHQANHAMFSPAGAALMTPALPGLGAPLFPFVPMSPFGGMAYKAEQLLGTPMPGSSLGLATPAPHMMGAGMGASSSATSSSGAPPLLSVGSSLLSPLPALSALDNSTSPPPVGMDIAGRTPLPVAGGSGSGGGLAARSSRRPSLCLDPSQLQAPLMDWGDASAAAAAAAAASAGASTSSFS